MLKLQQVLNAAAGVVTDTKKFDRGLHVAEPSHRAALARCTKASHVQDGRHDVVQLSTHGPVPQYLLDPCQPVSDVASRRHLRSADRRLLNVPHPEDEYICPAAGFLSGWPVGLELTAGLPERPGSQQRHFFLLASEDVFVRSVLIHIAHQRFYDDVLDKSTFYVLTYVHVALIKQE